MPELSAWWPFLTAFLALVAAGIGAPIPEEFPVIGAGIWVGSNPDFGPLRWLILPVCILGVLISDVTLYGIGRFWGPRLLKHRWLARVLPPDKRQRIERNFQQYGMKMLLFMRWMPGIRSPMFVTAGIMRLPLATFIVADGIAAVLGHSLLFFLAYWFGDQFRALVVEVKHAEDRIVPILILCGIGALAAYLLVHFLRRPVPTGDPKELPLIGQKLASRIEHLHPNPHQEPAGHDHEDKDHEPLSASRQPEPERQSPGKQDGPSP